MRLRPPAGGPGLSFRQDDRFRRPTWPSTGGEQQAHAHLDITTDDVDTAVARALGLGATVAPHHNRSPPCGCSSIRTDGPFASSPVLLGGEHDLVDGHAVRTDRAGP